MVRLYKNKTFIKGFMINILLSSGNSFIVINSNYKIMINIIFITFS